jgi:hypothetical protein
LPFTYDLNKAAALLRNGNMVIAEAADMKDSMKSEE